MSYFKDNPKALLDAIPTPRGEEEKMLRDIKNGLIPKADMNFRKANDPAFSNSMYLKSKMSIGDLSQSFGNSGLNTPSKRLQSPKFQTTSLISSRKLNISASRTSVHDALNLDHSSSRKSISSPFKNNIMSKTYTKDRKLTSIYNNPTLPTP